MTRAEWAKQRAAKHLKDARLWESPLRGSPWARRRGTAGGTGPYGEADGELEVGPEAPPRAPGL